MVLCDDLEGWDEGGGGRALQEGGNICIHVADSLCCTAETIIIKQLYSNKTIGKKYDRMKGVTWLYPKQTRRYSHSGHKYKTLLM